MEKVLASRAVGCLLHALKCDRSMAVPSICGGLPSLAPMFSATDSEMHVRHSNRYSSYLCLHPVKQQWFIFPISDVGQAPRCRDTEAFASCVLCSDTALEAREGGVQRIEFGTAQELGLFIVLWDRVNMYICLFLSFFCFVDFCLTLTYEYILYILPKTSCFWLIVIKLLSKWNKKLKWHCFCISFYCWNGCWWVSLYIT